MNIAFHSNQLSLRGTEVSMFDYARFNEEILGNKSIILAKDITIWPYSHPKAIEKFKSRFPVYQYKEFGEVDLILEKENIDIFYAQKAGFADGVLSKKCKNVIHSVFQYYEPHGHVYAYISKWLGEKYRSPFVPYIVHLPENNENLRDILKIPKESIVFGRHGGFETFDIKFVKDAVINIAKTNKNIYFLFMFTDRFSDESIKNIIYLDGNDNLEYKVKFINTCDAMLHARTVGETFGLAVAEFSIKNKPVITYGGPMRESAHLQMLSDKAIIYKDYNDLVKILNEFKPIDKDWNAYTAYSPEKVMLQFDSVFLK